MHCAINEFDFYAKAFDVFPRCNVTPDYVTQTKMNVYGNRSC